MRSLHAKDGGNVELRYYANRNHANQEFPVQDVIGDTVIDSDEAALEDLYAACLGGKEHLMLSQLWTKIMSGA